MGFLTALPQRLAVRACSHLAGASHPPLRQTTLGQAAAEAVEKWADRTALHFPAENVSLSYGEFHEQVESVAQGLLSFDLEPGSRVGILSPTCHRYIVCQFAAAKAGLTLVPINDRCHAHELDSALKRTSCSALLVGRGFKKNDYAQWARDLVRNKRAPLSLERYPALKYIISLDNTADDRGVICFSELLSLGQGRTWRLRSVSPDLHSVACMLHSSRSVMCCALPLYHAFGHVSFSICGILEGMTTMYLAPGTTAAHVLACIEQYRCTTIQGTPTLYHDLLACPELESRNISSLCEGVVGATSLQRPALEKIAQKLRIRRLLMAYGLTETAGPVAVGQYNEGGYRPLPHTEFHLRANELHVRGPMVFAGYFDHHESGLLPDGWLPTGDQAKLTETGLLNIRGRIKDLVIKGGVNISPEEIEIALTEHESVEEASVVGVPDERLGEELCAWVRLVPGVGTTEEQLRDHCKHRVNSLKVPKYIEIVDDFPRTSVGKISKPDIRSAMARKLGVQS
ncbi:medium-chain acyl-CoA ligase ACSF2, mitochondrial-like isoform X2 [Dermacentor albipictus]|uniref:medium-chain acyl-CoA ligase ACSF2, mitochondrial-like isoform X2 n=1 Tax=Dermacentor albipictus TaxID=60249 RepID=UPI0031FE0677